MYRQIIFGVLLAVAADAQTYSWQERTPSGTIVQGTVELSGDAPLAQYTLEGRVLTDAERTDLGIAPKDWSAKADIPSAAMPTPEAKTAQRDATPPRHVQGVVVDATPAPNALESHQAQAAEEAEKGKLVTGMFAQPALALSVTDGQSNVGNWTQQPGGGQALRYTVQSLGAVGIRIELTDLRLPPGGYVLVHGAASAEVFGPYATLGPDGDSLWTPAVAGELAHLDIVVPANANLQDIDVSVGRVLHQYLDPAALAKAAGACNLDATCSPAWAAVASGVGGLGVITSSGSLFCTCTLLNDADPCSSAPYVLTANHCVSGQAGSLGASNLEFYWQYDSTTCNGAPPSLATVPRTTGGADYLAGSGGTGYTGGGNDFTLLRMRNAPPGGLTALGFNSGAQPAGVGVTCVHHPRGDFKRITFGALDTGNVHAALYHEVVWSQGTTEPGSSGSALFLTATQQIIGQLWGGGASCFNPLSPDYYGRFDVTYPVIANYIGPTTAFVPVGSLSISEGPSAVITVQLSRPAPTGGAPIEVTLIPGTAQAGTDYVAANPAFTVAEGQTQGSFVLGLLDDTHLEPEETLSVTIASPGGCVADSGPFSIRIVDNDPDTDGDGISDADELSGWLGAVTDPLLADTDGDGILDSVEQSGSNGHITDPLNPDSDGDGMNDGLELWFGTDPNVPGVASLSTFRMPWFTQP